MPTYDYECSECGYYKEVFQKFSEKPLVRCPECKKHKFRRVIFLDLKIKPVSKAAKEFVELIVDLIAEVRADDNPKCRKQRGSAIENQRFIIGRIIGNIVHNEKNRIFQKIFVFFQ